MTSIESFDEFVQRTREVFFALRGLSDVMHADLDCTAVERGLLADLERLGPQTVPALAALRSVSRQALQKTVDRLVERGWLAGEPNPRHQRSLLVALTASGRKLFARLRARELELLAGLKLPVRLDELARTTATLALMADFLGSIDATRPRARAAR